MNDHDRALMIELGGNPEPGTFQVGDRVRSVGETGAAFRSIWKVDGGCLWLDPVVEQIRLSACWAEREAAQ